MNELTIFGTVGALSGIVALACFVSVWRSLRTGVAHSVSYAERDQRPTKFYFTLAGTAFVGAFALLLAIAIYGLMTSTDL